MSRSSLLRCASGSLLLAASSFFASTHAADAVQEVRLYALDCGRIQVKDMGMFSDTGEYNGKSGVLSDPCFVIRHPKGVLVWDTGLGDKLAETKGGIDIPVGHMQVDVTLLDQLKAIGLTPADVSYLSFSHTHFDHTGNANEFPGATWILSKAEIAWAESKPGAFVNIDTFGDYKTAKTQMIDGDYDVFGDGSVMILKTPGHTPGHQSLELKLKKSGVVILSGDLFHQRDNYRFRRVPPFNVERADTLASIDRVNTILKNTKGRLVVQHDANDFKSLPKFPKYLD
ncbi:N-acyl homoserine lactonase family protein [Nevskia soli]|uniref:N-acyl homoserine lactonase family protein n=1 Tax=Nevskia soli TaxID=418856 RepID=UPI0004A76ADE|nr:N-acyl homoserine lactonase family protein [Nevskia soli]